MPDMVTKPVDIPEGKAFEETVPYIKDNLSSTWILINMLSETINDQEIMIADLMKRLEAIETAAAI